MRYSGLPILLALTLVAIVSCTKSDSTKFASAAAQGGRAEVELGRLAVERGSNPAVTNFGQRMIEDHTKANSELMAIAKSKSIDLPNDLTFEQKSTIDKLSKLSGAEFDKEYMADMVSDHESDAKEFENQSQNGTDPELKAFAAKTLPLIQRHLQIARDGENQVAAR